MATIDRIESGPATWAPSAWTPSSAGIATEDETYTGRHRKPDHARTFSFHRMFHTAKHRRA